MNVLTAITSSNLNSSGHAAAANSTYPAHPHYNSKHGSSGCVSAATNSTTNPVFYLMGSNGNTGAASGGGGGNAGGAISASNMNSNNKHTNGAFMGPHHPAVHHPHSQHKLHPLAEGRKAKLRRFNSHDTNSNMFSVADFEYARLARRNEIELKQRLQRRMRHGYGGSGAGLSAGGTSGGQGLQTANASADYSTGDSKASKNSNEVCMCKYL